MENREQSSCNFNAIDETETINSAIVEDINEQSDIIEFMNKIHELNKNVLLLKDNEHKSYELLLSFAEEIDKIKQCILEMDKRMHKYEHELERINKKFSPF